MVCVRPGVLLVRASAFLPTSALIALDLPTLERPANAISGGPGGGSSEPRPAARRNSACAKTDMAKAGNSNKIAPFASGTRDEVRVGAGCPSACGKHALRAGQGAGNRGASLCRVSRRRRQQRRTGQPEDRRTDLRVPAEAAARLQ